MNAQTTKVELDQATRACYIRLLDATVAHTEPLDDDMCLLVDLDDMGETTGIEILDLDQDIPLSDLRRQFHIREKRAMMTAHLLLSVTKTPLFAVVADLIIDHDQTITMQKNTSRLAQHQCDSPPRAVSETTGITDPVITSPPMMRVVAYRTASTTWRLLHRGTPPNPRYHQRLRQHYHSQQQPVLNGSTVANWGSAESRQDGETFKLS